MTDWRSTLIAPTALITEAIRILDTAAKQVCLVADETQCLLGTVTDGDVRRAILKGTSLESPITQIMNPRPVTAGPEISDEDIVVVMRRSRLHQIPIVDSSNRILGLALLDDLIAGHHPENWVVLMAGGLGMRLRPLTESTPKPLLHIGNRPMLDIILESLIRQNFRRFYVSVNYRADMVKAHLGDGSRWGVEIRYLVEHDRLGTAGALSLLPEAPTAPIVVMNCDLLTKIDVRRLLDYHKESGGRATVAVRDYEFEVPFGVIRTEAERVVALDEKPIHRFLVNAGIYVLDPDAIVALTRNVRIDMTDLIECLLEKEVPVAAFPIREYWLDVGRIDDLSKANRDFMQNFSED